MSKAQVSEAFNLLKISFSMAKTAEEILADKRAEYHRNRDKYIAQKKRRYLENKEYILTKNKEWAKNNRARSNAIVKKCKDKNREKVRDWNREYQRNYMVENYDKYRASIDNYTKRNPAIVAARKADYRHRNRDKEAAWAAKRNLAIGDAKKNPQIIQLIYSWKAAKDTKCYYCNKPLFGKSVHIDHIVPLSRGGKHEIGNLCAACQPCNSSKHNKLPHEWRKEGQLLLV